MNADDIRAQCAQLLNDWGITYAAEFVPQRLSRNHAEKQPSINWIVTLRGARGPGMRVEYMQGIGHAPGYNSFRQTSHDRDLATLASQYGRFYGRLYKGKRVPVSKGGAFTECRLPAPQVADVLHCLVLDASALDHATYESWASDYGYDTDSRAGEAIYNACKKEAVEYQALFTATQRAQLAELLQDY